VKGLKKVPSFLSINDDIMQFIMNKLHEQRLKWRPHGKNSPTWHFFPINDESPFDLKVPQVMFFLML